MSAEGGGYVSTIKKVFIKIPVLLPGKKSSPEYRLNQVSLSILWMLGAIEVGIQENLGYRLILISRFSLKYRN